jgi:hypothetical protein
MIARFTEPLRPLSRLALVLAACGSLWDCGADVTFFVPAQDNNTSLDPAAATLPPLASAGPDREVLRGYRTQLDGTGTWSLDGAVLTLAWQQVSGAPVYLSNASDPAPYFIAPLDPQTLLFELTVTNGAFTVKDQVAIAVSNDPHRLAPVVNGGPDQIGDALDPMTPTSTDAQSQLTWTEVTPDRAALAGKKSGDVYSGPRIYKLTGIASGLESAPDYVLVHPASDTETTAPVSSAVGPTEATTGSMVTLAATASGGSGERLTYHWEQTRGAPVLQNLDAKSSEIGVEIPRVSQQLVFRVHAFDGLLASAPADVVLEVVPSDGLHPGQLVPGSDVRARPGSSVRLLASANGATPGATFAWQQTRGGTVEVSQETDHITFPAPSADDELAFVVSSTIDHADSAPAAYRVVVTDIGNSAPRISACLPQQIVAGTTVEVSVRTTDPDGDPIDTTSADAGATTVTEVGSATIGDCAVEPSAALGSSVTHVYALQAPLAGSSVALTLTSTDVRGATRDVIVTIAP